jgi:hypothetical protein
VTTIGEYAFYDCDALTSVVVPNGVTKIDKYTFQSCSNLTSVVIGNSVTSIGAYAFSGCGLISVEIPSSVTLFDGNSFYANRNLKRVDLSTHTSVPTLSYLNVFLEAHADLQFKVPANLIDEWKSATNWSNYADKIVTEFTNTL